MIMVEVSVVIFMQTNEIGYGDTCEGMCIFHQMDEYYDRIP